MAKVAPLNIPVTVDTSGMDRGLAVAEQKMKRGAERINAAATASGAGAGGRAGKGIAMAGASSLGFGAAGGALGAMGTAGLGIGLALAPLLAASRMAEAMATASKGATQALEDLRTGATTSAKGFEGVNEAILKQLAARERLDQTAVQAPSMAQSFAFAEKAAGGVGPTTSQTYSDFFSNMKTSGSALLGAVMGGATSGEADLLALAATTQNSKQAERLTQLAKETRRAELSEGYSTFGSAPLSFMAEALAKAIYGVQTQTGL